MGCAEYQERIEELALEAANDAAEPGLARHLAGCAVCGEELAMRRALLARIDSGVAALVGGDAPQSLAARVRQQIAIEDAKPRRAFAANRWAWIAGAGVALAAAAILLAIAMRPVNRGEQHQENVAAKAAPVAAPSRLAAPSLAQPARAAAHQAPANEAISKSSEPRTAAAASVTVAAATVDSIARTMAIAEADTPTLEVLIPANQNFGIHQLLHASRPSQLDEAMSRDPSEPKPIDPIELKPLKIESIAPPDGQINQDSGRNQF